MRTTASTRASATRCGRWLIAATARSWVTGSSVTRRAPSASQKARHPLDRVRVGALGRGHDDGRALEEIGARDARSRSARSPPSDGCPRRRAAGRRARGARPRRTMPRLGAADVGEQSPPRAAPPTPRAAARSRVATGVASRQKSAPATPVARGRCWRDRPCPSLERGLEARPVAGRPPTISRPAPGRGRPWRPSRPAARGRRREPSDHALLAPARTFRSAFTSRRFSSGVPMVMRSARLHPEAASSAARSRPP